MACTLLARLFPGTNLSPRVQTTRHNLAGTMDRSTSDSTTNKPVLSLSKVKAAMLSSIKPEPFVSICMHSVPGWLGQTAIEAFFQNLPQLARLRHKKTTWPIGKHNFLLDFEPGTDALKALNADKFNPIVTINHHELSVYCINDSFYAKDYKIVYKRNVQSLISLPRSEDRHTSLKLDNADIGTGECCICRNDLDASFSTPCFNCKSAECYECIQRHFREAVKDFERFPAKCCEIAFHPDVAKGILPEEEHTKYKTRFEEHLAKKPIYCPMPTCSAFIPERETQHVLGDSFPCPACQESLCVSCKKQNHAGQPCEMSSQELEAAEVLKKFGYKQCPKCGIAVGKMYGCSHVRCNCGAHWCWECRRKIEICNISPCPGASGEDFYGEFQGQDWADDLSDIDSVADSGNHVDSGNTETLLGVQGAHLMDEVSNSAPKFTASSDDEPTNVPALNTTLELASHPRTNPEPISTAQSELSKAIQADLAAASTREAIGNSIDLDLSALTTRTRLANRFVNPHQPPAQQATQVMSEDVEMKDTSPGLPATRLDTNILGSTIGSAATPANTDNVPESPVTAIRTGSTTEPSFINLDDPAAKPWENENLNLGEDPSDEDPLDIWGCVHQLVPLTSNKIPRYWMTASVPDWWERNVRDREIGCMLCWKKTKLALPQEDVDAMEDGEEKRKIVKDWRSARHCSKCKIVVCRKCKNELIKSEH